MRRLVLLTFSLALCAAAPAAAAPCTKRRREILPVSSTRSPIA